MQMALEVFYHMCVLFDAEEDSNSVQQSKTYLDKCVLKTQHMKQEESGDVMGKEESTIETTAPSIIRQSPFTHAFQVRQDHPVKEKVPETSRIHIQNDCLNTR